MEIITFDLVQIFWINYCIAMIKMVEISNHTDALSKDDKFVKS